MARRYPKSLEDVPVDAVPAREGRGGCGRSVDGRLLSYGLRFLPVETLSLTKCLRETGEDSSGVAVFAASRGDAGAKVLGKRLRSAEVYKGAVDPFPLACCLPDEEGGASKWIGALNEIDSAELHCEPPGEGVDMWRRARVEEAAWLHGVSPGEVRRSSVLSPREVLILRFSGSGAVGFVSSLFEARVRDPGPSDAKAAACEDTGPDGGAESSRCDGPCPCTSSAWVPAVVFVTG